MVQETKLTPFLQHSKKNHSLLWSVMRSLFWLNAHVIVISVFIFWIIISTHRTHKKHSIERFGKRIQPLFLMQHCYYMIETNVVHISQNILSRKKNSWNKFAFWPQHYIHCSSGPYSSRYQWRRMLNRMCVFAREEMKEGTSWFT